MIPIVLCIDAEPDGPGHVTPPGGPWAGFVATHGLLTGLRGRIEDVMGRPPVFSWFLRMDPQITETSGSVRHVVDAHPEVIADIVDRGEPLGLHIHGWRPSPDSGWVDDFEDRPWLAHCIESSFVAYADAFGAPCRLVRMGARFLDDWTVERLAERGTTIDLSLEPANSRIPSGQKLAVRGDLPDTRRTPRAPHRVAPGMIELPLSASSRLKGWHPRRHASRIRHHGVFQRLDFPIQMGREVETPDTFDRRVRRTLRGQRHPYLAYALRSDSVITEGKRPRVEAQIDTLIQVGARQEAAFLGPEETLAALDVR